MEVSEVMNNVILMNKGKGIKLKSAFLEKCKAAEKQFAKFVPDTTIDIEFVDFLHEKYYLVKDMSEKQFTEYVINLKSEIYPNFVRYKSKYPISNDCSLCQILAVLPASSVDCECGFSNLNRIKRDDRNRVDGDHLVWLMHVSSFDMDQIDFEKRHLPLLLPSWKAKKERRLDGRADLNLES